MLGSLLWMSPPALAAHVVHAHIAQRHAAVLRVNLGIIADEHLKHIRLGAHDGIVDGAAPLRLINCKGVGALPQQILRAIRMPACMHVLSSNVSQVSLSADDDFLSLRLVACKGVWMYRVWTMCVHPSQQ